MAMWGGRLLARLGDLADWGIVIAADDIGLQSEFGFASTGTVRVRGCRANGVGAAAPA
jgi:hypothetical protein